MRAAAEQLFWAIGQQGARAGRQEGRTARRAGGPARDLSSDIYFCNFSLFQSMPDSWAIDQLFPICPIHRLNERAHARGRSWAISRATRDGKVDHFVDKRVDKKALELHEVKDLPGEGAGVEPYYLGVFLLGAYQEILGDLHNLLGDTHAVHISLSPQTGNGGAAAGRVGDRRGDRGRHGGGSAAVRAVRHRGHEAGDAAGYRGRVPAGAADAARGQEPAEVL